MSKQAALPQPQCLASLHLQVNEFPVAVLKLYLTIRGRDFRRRIRDIKKGKGQGYWCGKSTKTLACTETLMATGSERTSHLEVYLMFDVGPNSEKVSIDNKMTDDNEMTVDSSDVWAG